MIKKVLILFFLFSVERIFSQGVNIRSWVNDIVHENKGLYRKMDTISLETEKWLKAERPAEWFFCKTAYSVYKEESSGTRLALIHMTIGFIESDAARNIPENLFSKMKRKLSEWLYDATADETAISKKERLKTDPPHSPQIVWANSMKEHFPGCWQGLSIMENNKDYQGRMLEECAYKYQLTKALCKDHLLDSFSVWKGMEISEFDGGLTVFLIDNDSATQIIDKKASRIALLVERFLKTEHLSIQRIEIEVDYPSQIWNENYSDLFYKGAEVIFDQEYIFNNTPNQVTIPSGARMKNSDLGLLRLMEIGRMFRLSYEDGKNIPDPIYRVSTNIANPSGEIKIHITFK